MQHRVSNFSFCVAWTRKLKIRTHVGCVAQRTSKQLVVAPPFLACLPGTPLAQRRNLAALRNLVNFIVQQICFFRQFVASPAEPVTDVGMLP